MPGYQQPNTNPQEQNQTPGRTAGQDAPKPHQGQNNMERGATSDDEHESLLDLEPTTTPGRDLADTNAGATRDLDPQNRRGQRDDDTSRTNQSSQGQPNDASQTQRQGGQPPR